MNLHGFRNYSGHSAFHHEDHKEITKCAKIAGFLPFFVIFAPSLRSLWLKAEQLPVFFVFFV
jgi:hypothetical protein